MYPDKFVTKSGKVYLPEASVPPVVKFVGWRGLHGIEGGRGAPTGMPAILPPIDTRALDMTDDIQRMSFALARRFAPSIDGNKWRAMHGDQVAMTNGEQNGYGSEPHRDIINNRDLNSPPPRYDKMQRSFAGSFIRGEVIGERIYCEPGVHGIDAREPMPDTDTIIKNNWYVIACTSGDKIWNFVPDHPAFISDPSFVQGNGDPVVYPFIFDRVISFPLVWFQRWERDYLPNHLLTYS